MSKPVFLRLPEDLICDLERYKPKTMSLTGYCAFLIELGVDREVTLAERPTGSEASNSSSSINKEDLNLNTYIRSEKANENTEKEPKTGKSRKKPAYTEEFLEFW